MTGMQHHVSEEVLLLYADGELTKPRRAAVEAHLKVCVECLNRREEMGRTLAEFSQAYRALLDPKLPPVETSRAALRLRMAQLNAESQVRKSWSSWLGSALTPSRGGYVFASLILGLVLTVGVYRREIRSESQQISASLGLWPEPKASLTPGATVPVTKAQVCAASEDRSSTIPISLQRKVSALYGVSGTPPDAYEVDYLITPELGGATDIRNLWPEPYDTAWNAHVKDQLEERLHQMVCHGDVDLATAQQDISKDWIAAYRKYFHTDKPITGATSLHRL